MLFTKQKREGWLLAGLTAMCFACVPPGQESLSGSVSESETLTFEEAVARVAGTSALTPIAPPSPEGCVQNVGPGTQVLGCAGAASYTLTVPDYCTQYSCGLILDVHGLTMNANSQDAATRMRQRVLSTTELPRRLCPRRAHV